MCMALFVCVCIWRVMKNKKKQKGLLDSLVGLEKLSANGIGLKTFSGLSRLARLRVIKASDNKVTGPELASLAHLGSLEELDLSGNRINSMDDLEPLKECANLRSIDLECCPVATENYEVRRRNTQRTLPTNFTVLLPCASMRRCRVCDVRRKRCILAAVLT